MNSGPCFCIHPWQSCALSRRPDGIVDQVLAVDPSIAERAKQIVLGHRRVSARDAVHLAVMEQHGIEQILTFDSGFDGFPGVTRLS